MLPVGYLPATLPAHRTRAMAFYLPIILTALATTVYHVAQKSVAPEANPLVSLVMTYLTALGVSLGALLASTGGRALAAAVHKLNWASYVVGLLFYREHLAAKHVLGVGLCLAGLVLVAQR